MRIRGGDVLFCSLLHSKTPEYLKKRITLKGLCQTHTEVSGRQMSVSDRGELCVCVCMCIGMCVLHLTVVTCCFVGVYTCMVPQTGGLCLFEYMNMFWSQCVSALITSSGPNCVKVEVARL